MVLTAVGGLKSMPNRMGMLMGTKEHMRIGCGMISPVSLETAELTRLLAFFSVSKSILLRSKGLP